MLLTLTAAFTAVSVKAATTWQAGDLKVSPMGLLLLDGSVYHSNNEGQFTNGVAMPDIRIGLKANYGPFNAIISAGYAYGKVTLMDVYVDWLMNKNMRLRAGNFIHQAGIQAAYGSAYKVTMEEPVAPDMFIPKRLLGLQYIGDLGKAFAAASIYAESQSMLMRANQMNQTGYGAFARGLYRPFTQEGKILQAGLTLGIESPRYNAENELNHKSFTLTGYFPSRVCQVKGIDATIDHARSMLRVAPEATAALGRVAVEGSYYYTHVWRKDALPSYTATGCYAQVRGLILGKDYEYNSVMGGINMPRPGSLECTLGYSYADLTDGAAGIYGGRMNDASCTFTYHINKCMLARLRYSYTHTKGCANLPNTNLNMLALRVQFFF